MISNRVGRFPPPPECGGLKKGFQLGGADGGK